MNSTSAEFSEWEYRNIALAAATQCAVLVQELATRGRAEPRALQACVAPLLVLNPGSTAEVLPDISAFSKGLQTLQQALDNNGTAQHPDVVRYLLGMTVLQHKLMKLPRLQAKLRDGLSGIQFDTSAAADESFPFNEVARIYQDTISTLSFRIHVGGNPEYLKSQAVADSIRTLLLAGIRCAVLWHQLGGRRWHLLFQRKQIRECIIQIRRRMFTVN